ncbi:lysophospholipid acyltransferase family protein [Pseudomonadota bacterium]
MADPIEPVSYRAVTLTDWFGAGFAYLGVFVLRLLPFSWASALGGALASTFGPMLKKTKVARRNLKAAFPDKSEAEIDTIIREVWDNLGRTAFEFPLMDRFLSGRDAERITTEGRDDLSELMAGDKPVLFFGGHLGSWEVPPVLMAMRGYKVNSFYRAPNNPLLLKLFTSRKNPGELIPKGAPGAKRAFTLLKKGEHLGILVDQKLNDGIPVPLFGRDAMTGTALAEFALRFDATIVPFHCVRLPGAKFKIIFEAPLEIEKTGDKKEDVRAIMVAANALLEDWIRENPGQWLWLHKRWPD